MKTEKKSTNARIILVKYLVKTYPYLWQSTEPSVIKNVGLVDIQLLVEKMEEATTVLGISSNTGILIHKPVSSFSDRFVDGIIGHKSQKYETIEISLNGKSYFIKYSSGSSINGFSTMAKESLFIYFTNHRIRYTKFKMTRNPNFVVSYNRLLRQLINDINKNGIKGISIDDTRELLIELNNELLNEQLDPNRAMLKTIFNAMSGGNNITKILPKGYTLYRNDYFMQIRKFIGFLNNSNRIDNFCPMDVVAIRDGFELQLSNVLNMITQISSIEKRKDAFNALCADSETIKSSLLPIWCISLKQEVAAGGKGKSAIGKGGNLTKNDQSISVKEQISRISEIRNRLMVSMNTGNIKFNVLGDMDRLIEKNTTINKLSAITLLDYMANSNTLLINTLEKTVSTCAGLGNNPPFTKMILNECGDDKKVKYIDYPENYTIKLSPYHPIDIVDKNSSNSIDITFFIEDIDSKTGMPKTSNVKIELRTNGLCVQSSVELKYL